MPDSATSRPRSLFQRLLRHPQQLWARRAIFQIHLWAGILLGLYLIVISLSGSILVFREELQPRPHVSIPSRDLSHCTPEQLTQAIDRVNRTYPGSSTYLASCPDEADPLFALSTRSASLSGTGRTFNQLTVYVHPVSGAILGQADTEHSWIHWVEDLHVYLLAGHSGEQWNGVGAAALLLLVLTGLVLWWPGIQRWKRAFFLDLRRSWRRINWDLHSITGIWTVLFTLTWATTGIYFAWPKATAAAIDKLSPIITARYPSAELAGAAATIQPDTGQFDLLTVLQKAQQASPKGALEGCFYGSGSLPLFTVYMARGRVGDYANTDFLYFDQHSGRLLYTWHRGENLTLGDWLLWLTTPLHFGTSWGLAIKILWFCLGLALPVLTVTGFLMYWNRYLRNKLRTT